jgi:hypothetical protein
MKSFLRRRGGPFQDSRLLPLGDQARRRHLGPHPGQAHQDLGLGEGGEEGLGSGFRLGERETQKPNFWVR